MSIQDNNYYKLLGLSTEAAIEDIQLAYDKLALQYHPEKNPTLSSEDKEKFLAIQKAYTVLSNPLTRDEYDTVLFDETELGFFALEEPAATESPFSPSRSVEKTTFSIKKYLLRAKLDAQKLLELAIKSESFAESILNDERLYNQFSNSIWIEKIGLAHESIARKIVTNYNLLLSIHFNRETIYRLAERYPSICQIVFATSYLIANLDGQQIAALQTLHGVMAKDKNNTAPRSEIIVRASEWFKPLFAGQLPEDFSVDLFKQKFIAANYIDDQLIEMAVKNLTIAEISIRDFYLSRFIRLSPNNIIRICKAHESIALQFVSNPELFSIISSHSNIIYSLAESHASVCSAIFNSAAVDKLNGEQITQLRKRYGTVIFSKAISISQVFNTYRSYQWLQPFLEGKVPDAFSLEEFKQHFIIAKLKSAHLITMAQHSLAIAEFCFQDLHLKNVLMKGHDPLKNLGITYSSIALKLLQAESIWFIFDNPSLVFTIAIHHLSACKIILQNTVLCDFLTGKHLHKIMTLYGNEAAVYIQNNEILNERLEAYVLLKKGLKTPVLTRAREGHSVSHKDNGASSYQMGLWILDSTIPDNIRIAIEYFLKSARSGSTKALDMAIKTLAQLKEEARGTVEFEIAEICATTPAYQEQSIEWYQRAAAQGVIRAFEPLLNSVVSRLNENNDNGINVTDTLQEAEVTASLKALATFSKLLESSNKQVLRESKDEINRELAKFYQSIAACKQAIFYYQRVSNLTNDELIELFFLTLNHAYQKQSERLFSAGNHSEQVKAILGQPRFILARYNRALPFAIKAVAKNPLDEGALTLFTNALDEIFKHGVPKEEICKMLLNDVNLSKHLSDERRLHIFTRYPCIISDRNKEFASLGIKIHALPMQYIDIRRAFIASLMNRNSNDDESSNNKSSPAFESIQLSFEKKICEIKRHHQEMMAQHHRLNTAIERIREYATLLDESVPELSKSVLKVAEDLQSKSDHYYHSTDTTRPGSTKQFKNALFGIVKDAFKMQFTSEYEMDQSSTQPVSDFILELLLDAFISVAKTAHVGFLIPAKVAETRLTLLTEEIARSTLLVSPAA